MFLSYSSLKYQGLVHESNFILRTYKKTSDLVFSVIHPFTNLKNRINYIENMQLITIIACLTILSSSTITIEGMLVFFCSDKCNLIDVILAQLVDIVQTAVNNGNFRNLIQALEAADLVSALKGPGPFTVFAPTDEATEKLSTAVVDDLFKPENKAVLARILKYHVISGRAITSEQISGVTLPIKQQMLDGGEITVNRNGNSVKINNATVVLADVMASNGVIHAIDEVLLPPEGDFTWFFL